MSSLATFSMSSTAVLHRKCILILSLLFVLIGNVSCLALRVEGSLSASSPAAAVIHSIRQKGGITQRILWKEQDYSNQVLSSNSSIVGKSPSSTSSQKLFQFFQFRSFLPSLRSTFLPVSYPHQIPPGYLRYSIWSWTQDWSTQLRSVLATQRVLQGVGVGRSDATTLAAVYNFILRDGCGMLATLLFTAVASSNFGTNIKPWRLFADIMVDIGITLEVLATGAPRKWFLPMICVGNMCKAMTGVAAGACAGVINLYWATPLPATLMATTPESAGGENGDAHDNTSSHRIVVQAPPPNIADIQAKFNAQHTVTASLGLVMAAWFAKSVSALQHGWHLAILYTALTVLHLFANVQCLRCLAFTGLNPTRFAMVTNHFLDWWYSHPRTDESDATSSQLRSHGNVGRNNILPLSLPTPTDIAKTEPLLFLQPQGMPRLLRQEKASGGRDRPRIQMGLSFPDWWKFVAQHQEAEHIPLQSNVLSASTTVANNTTPMAATFMTQRILQSAKMQLAKQNYLLAIGRCGTHSSMETATIAVSFGQNVTARQMAWAYFEAHVLWSRQYSQQSNVLEQQKMNSYEHLLDWEQSDEWRHMWRAFQVGCAQAGWNLDATQLPTRGYQIDWQ